MKIVPTVGRVVLYKCEHNDEVHCALIAKVNSDNNINIAAFDSHGVSYSRTYVLLLQEGDETDAPGYAFWMPYQIGQAAKTEALQAAITGGQVGGLGGNAAGEQTPSVPQMPDDARPETPPQKETAAA